MAESKDVVQYDKAELRRVTSAFKAMDDEAVAEAKASSSALADYLKSKILEAAYATSNIGDDRIAEGSKVSKSSKIGEISFGFAGQKFSGGATTRDLWGGSEFGSNKKLLLNSPWAESSVPRIPRVPCEQALRDESKWRIQDCSGAIKLML